MTNVQALIIGVSIIIGFTIFGIVSSDGGKAADASVSMREYVELQEKQYRNERTLARERTEVESERVELEEMRVLLENTRLEVLAFGGKEYLHRRVLRLRSNGSYSVYSFLYEQRDGKLVEIDLPGVLPD